MAPSEFRKILKLKTNINIKPEFEHQEIAIIAGGDTVKSDYKKLVSRKNTQEFPVQMAVNAIGMFVPDKLTFWYSNHLPNLQAWRYVRRLSHMHNDEPTLVTPPHSLHSKGLEIPLSEDRVVKFDNPDLFKAAKHSGSCEDSGFLAMCLAVALGYKRVWLIGLPGDHEGHALEFEWSYHQKDVPTIKRVWLDWFHQFPIIGERVRSFSGFTHKLFGDKD